MSLTPGLRKKRCFAFSFTFPFLGKRYFAFTFSVTFPKNARNEKRNFANRKLADFYIPRLSNDMKFAVQKIILAGQILYRSPDPKDALKNTQEF